MIELPNVTVIIADTKNYGPAAYAITKTLEQIKPARTVWLTDIECMLPDVDVIKIPKIKSKAEYSKIIIKELWEYFDTSHCLVIQHDGYVINSDCWDDKWHCYDYIGAPWLYPDPDRNVGNGGFSLRSKSLQQALCLDKSIEIIEPEDEVIGRLYRRYLEDEHDMLFAPEDVAHMFSYELHEPYGKTFGFHGYFHPPFKEVVVINRTGAMGDVIQVEPVLEHYWKKGFRVVLRTLPEFYSLFANHYFPVEYYETFNKAVPHNYIDLDMSYEAKPKQLHLKSYYEMCGITDGKIRSAKLNFSSDSSIKLFKQKYVVIHIDKRPQPGRNVENIEWHRVSTKLRALGYLVVQVSKNDAKYIPGSIQINTIELGMLAYVISGCDLFIGVDSGPSHIAVATGRNSVVFFGSVNPEYIHADNHNPLAIYQNVCEKPGCWSEVVGTTGMDCYIDKDHPPCNQHDTDHLLTLLNILT